MSNPKKWQVKPRTAKPNARQKRNGLYLDQHPTCVRCCSAQAAEAHHTLALGHPDRYDWKFMQALCTPCHVAVHQSASSVIVVVINPSV